MAGCSISLEERVWMACAFLAESTGGVCPQDASILSPLGGGLIDD